MPGDQTPVWLHQGPLSRLGQEHRACADPVRTIQSVDGAPAVAAGQGIMLSGASQRRKKP
nr:hypothetical protein [Xanthomonas fragariae]